MMKAEETESLLNMEGGSSNNKRSDEAAAQAVIIGSTNDDEVVMVMDCEGSSSSEESSHLKIPNNKSDNDDDHDDCGDDDEEDSPKAKSAASEAVEAEKEKGKNNDDVALLKRILMTWGSVLALLGLVTILLVVLFEAFIMAFIPLGCIHWLILQPQLDNILVGGWMNNTIISTTCIQLQHRHRRDGYQKNIIQGICNAVLSLDKDLYGTSTTIAIGFINCLPLGPKDDTPFIVKIVIIILMIIWGSITGAISIHIPLRKLHRTVKDWPNTQQLRAREFLVLRCFAVVGCSMIGIILSLSLFDDKYPAAVGTVVAMIVYLGLLCLTAIIRLGRYMHKQDWYRKSMMWDVTTTPTTTTTTTSTDASNSHTVV